VRRGHIVLRKQVPENLPAIECDPEQVTQVLLNLTINAIQAMPEGGEIVLSARPQGGNVAVEVRDQGSGISEQDMERIFDPFFYHQRDGDRPWALRSASDCDRPGRRSQRQEKTTIKA